MVDNRPVVLLVDDEPDIVELLSLVLEQEGYRPVECSSGEEALVALQRGERPAAIVLDLMMPELSGFQLCRLLKTRQDWRDIPVLILTARTQPLDRYRAKDCGADAFLTKPFQLERVLQTLAGMAGAPRVTPG